MYLVDNERTKLTATWFNTLATALIAAGALAPIAAIVIGFSAPLATGAVLGLAAACMALGVAIHVSARAILGRLRE